MKKHLIVSGIVFVLVMVGLSGCIDSTNSVDADNEKFFGSWTGEIKGELSNETVALSSVNLTFFSNNTFQCRFYWYVGPNSNQTYTGPWHVSNKVISFHNVNDATYTFSNNNQSLKID